MAEQHGESASEYIQHHLTNLTVCRKDGDWVWNECKGNFFAHTRFALEGHRGAERRVGSSG